MNTHVFSFRGETLHALPSGALYWPEARLLTVSDLHFGKAARQIHGGGALLPPYETRETLTRLEADIDSTGAQGVICLGDSFDAPQLGGALPEADQLWLMRLMAGRDWVWIEGNHDPGPVALGGAHLRALARAPLVFRHIATGAEGEVTGHYHPKARLALRGRRISRPCFLYDRRHLILPAYGTYTGGLCCTHPTLQGLFPDGARAILTGRQALEIPMPRAA